MDCAFGQFAFHQNTAKDCVAADVGKRGANGLYEFLEKFFSLAEKHVVFQSKIDQVLVNSAKAWQDAIEGIPEKHMAD